LYKNSKKSSLNRKHSFQKFSLASETNETNDIRIFSKFGKKSVFLGQSLSYLLIWRDISLPPVFYKNAISPYMKSPFIVLANAHSDVSFDRFFFKKEQGKKGLNNKIKTNTIETALLPFFVSSEKARIQKQKLSAKWPYICVNKNRSQNDKNQKFSGYSEFSLNTSESIYDVSVEQEAFQKYGKVYNTWFHSSNNFNFLKKKKLFSKESKQSSQHPSKKKKFSSFLTTPRKQIEQLDSYKSDSYLVQNFSIGKFFPHKKAFMHYWVFPFAGFIGYSFLVNSTQLTSSKNSLQAFPTKEFQIPSILNNVLNPSVGEKESNSSNLNQLFFYKEKNKEPFVSLFKPSLLNLSTIKQKSPNFRYIPFLFLNNNQVLFFSEEKEVLTKNKVSFSMLQNSIYLQKSIIFNKNKSNKDFLTSQPIKNQKKTTFLLNSSLEKHQSDYDSFLSNRTNPNKTLDNSINKISNGLDLYNVFFSNVKNPNCDLKFPEKLLPINHENKNRALDGERRELTSDFSLTLPLLSYTKASTILDSFYQKLLLNRKKFQNKEKTLTNKTTVTSTLNEKFLLPSENVEYFSFLKEKEWNSLELKVPNSKEEKMINLNKLYWTCQKFLNKTKFQSKQSMILLISESPFFQIINLIKKSHDSIASELSVPKNSVPKLLLLDKKIIGQNNHAFLKIFYQKINKKNEFFQISHKPFDFAKEFHSFGTLSSKEFHCLDSIFIKRKSPIFMSYLNFNKNISDVAKGTTNGCLMPFFLSSEKVIKEKNKSLSINESFKKMKNIVPRGDWNFVNSNKTLNQNDFFNYRKIQKRNFNTKNTFEYFLKNIIVKLSLIFKKNQIFLLNQHNSNEDFYQSSDFNKTVGKKKVVKRLFEKKNHNFLVYIKNIENRRREKIFRTYLSCKSIFKNSNVISKRNNVSLRVSHFSLTKKKQNMSTGLTFSDKLKKKNKTKLKFRKKDWQSIVLNTEHFPHYYYMIQTFQNFQKPVFDYCFFANKKTEAEKLSSFSAKMYKPFVNKNVTPQKIVVKKKKYIELSRNSKNLSVEQLKQNMRMSSFFYYPPNIKRISSDTIVKKLSFLFRSNFEETQLEENKETNMRLTKKNQKQKKRKKRKRFYPRPTWLRFFLYKKFLGNRFKINNSIDFGNEFHFIPLSSSKNSIQKAYPLLSFKNGLLRLKTIRNFYSSFRSKSSKTSKLNLSISYKNKKWKNHTTHQKSWASGTQSILNNPTHSFFQISNSVMSDFQRLCWKSYWLRSNLTPYIQRVQKSMSELKRKETKWRLIQLFQNSVSEKSISTNMGFSKFFPFVEKRPDFPKVESFQNNKKNQKNWINNKGFVSWYFNIQKEPISSYEKLRNISEYDKLLYNRISSIIENVKINLAGNGQSNPKCFKPKGSDPQKEELFYTKPLSSSSKSIWQNLGIFLNPNQTPILRVSSANGEFATLRACWSLNQTNVLSFKDRNKTKILWSQVGEQKNRLSNKKFLVSIWKPVSNNFDLNMVSSFFKKTRPLKEISAQSATSLGEKSSLNKLQNVNKKIHYAGLKTQSKDFDIFFRSLKTRFKNTQLFILKKKKQNFIGNFPRISIEPEKQSKRFLHFWWSSVSNSFQSFDFNMNLPTSALNEPFSFLKQSEISPNLLTSLVLCGLAFHICTLFSLIQIPEIRSFVKFYILLLYKLSNSYLIIINFILNSLKNSKNQFDEIFIRFQNFHWNENKLLSKKDVGLNFSNNIDPILFFGNQNLSARFKTATFYRSSNKKRVFMTSSNFNSSFIVFQYKKNFRDWSIKKSEGLINNFEIGNYRQFGLDRVLYLPNVKLPKNFLFMKWGGIKALKAENQKLLGQSLLWFSLLSTTKNLLELFYYSISLSSLFLFKIIDILEGCMLIIYQFLEKPAELMVEWIAQLFLVEWSSDVSDFIPESLSIYTWSSMRKFWRGCNIFGIFGFLIQRRLWCFLEIFIQSLTKQDSDLLTRQKKGVIFWDIWAEVLIQAAEKYNMNLQSLSTLKEEQEAFLEQLLDTTQPNLFEKAETSITEPLNKNFLFQTKFNKNELNKKSQINKALITESPQTNIIQLSSRLILTERPRSLSFSLQKESPFVPFFFFMKKKRKEEREGLKIPFLARNRTKFTLAESLLSEKKYKNSQALTEPLELRENFLNQVMLLAKTTVQKDSSIFSLIKPSNIQNIDWNETKSSIWRRWSANQYFTNQGIETDLFIDVHPPKSFSHMSFYSHQGISASAAPIASQIQTLGLLTCQISSGLFQKQVSKNILIVGSSSFSQGHSGLTQGKSLLIYALAGETELQIVSDNAYRYAHIQRGVAVGMKLLRDVFDALTLHTPCIFLMEDIHAIGERRPMLISDNEYGKESTFASENEEVHEKNQLIYQSNRHSVVDYRRPYKGDFSLLIPTNHFCFDLFLGVSSPKIRKTNWGGFSSFKSPFINQAGVLSSDSEENKNQQSSGFKKQGASSGAKNQFSFQKNAKFDFMNQKSSIYQSNLQFSAQQLFAPPATSPFTILGMREQRRFKYRKIVQEIPWGGFSNDQMMLVSKVMYSIRVKIALLADMAMNQLSVKLDMITDLLVIMDNVRTNRGFVVFATTHVPFVLDPALRRPGRFDETVSIPLLPNLLNRYEIFKTNFQNYSSTIDFLDYSSLLNKLTEADLFNFISRTKFLLFNKTHSAFVPSLSQRFNNYNSVKLLPKYTPMVNPLGLFSKEKNELDFNYLKKNDFVSYLEKRIQFETSPYLITSISQAMKFMIQINTVEPYRIRFNIVKASQMNQSNVKSSDSFWKQSDPRFQKSKSTQFQNRSISNFLKNKTARFTLPLSQLGLTVAYSQASKFLTQSQLLVDNNYLTEPFMVSSLSLSTPFSINEISTLFANMTSIEKSLLYLLSGKVGEFFILKNCPPPSFKFFKEFDSFGTGSLKTFYQPNLLEKQLVGSEIDSFWHSATTFVFSFLQKRFLYNQNLLSKKFFYLNDKAIRKEPPSPPTSSILMPAKKYENLKRMERDFSPAAGTGSGSGGFAVSQKKSMISIQEKIQIHQQQRSMRNLYEQPVLNLFRSEMVENRLTQFHSSFKELNYYDSFIRKPSVVNCYYKNRILTRHKFSLLNQWWNGQLAEHNVETTIHSDVDWRSMFSDEPAFGDLILDFPDADIFYNPKSRRWFLQSSYSGYWFTFEKSLSHQIYYHFIVCCLNKILNSLDKEREVLDYFAYFYLQKGFFQEIDSITTLSRFYFKKQ
jgi:SpoVK/Ycf46/Vps4 family AAA+-type ATPase